MGIRRPHRPRDRRGRVHVPRRRRRRRRRRSQISEAAAPSPSARARELQAEKERATASALGGRAQAAGEPGGRRGVRVPPRFLRGFEAPEQGVVWRGRPAPGDPRGGGSPRRRYPGRCARAAAVAGIGRRRDSGADSSPGAEFPPRPERLGGKPESAGTDSSTEFERETDALLSRAAALMEEEEGLMEEEEEGLAEEEEAHGGGGGAHGGGGGGRRAQRRR